MKRTTPISVIAAILEEAVDVTTNGGMDYLGNNRAVVNGTTGAIEQTTAYYPYGAVIADLNVPIIKNSEIPSSDIKIRIKSDKSVMEIHRNLIDYNSKNLWDQINQLLLR